MQTKIGEAMTREHSPNCRSAIIPIEQEPTKPKGHAWCKWHGKACTIGHGDDEHQALAYWGPEEKIPSEKFGATTASSRDRHAVEESGDDGAFWNASTARRDEVNTLRRNATADRLHSLVAASLREWPTCPFGVVNIEAEHFNSGVTRLTWVCGCRGCGGVL